MSLTAFALTAGLGTRLRPYTETRAKPAIPFLGVPLVLHALRHLEELPVRRLFLNLHHAPDSLREVEFGALKLPHIDWVDETSRILGSGGALANVIHEISTTQILLLNGDEVYLPQSAQVLVDALREHERRDRIATLVTMKHPEVGLSLGGAWTADAETVRKFSKTAVAGMTGHHYVGYLFLNRRVQRYFEMPVREENILYETLTRAIAAGEEVGVFDHPAYWFETGRTDLFLKSSDEVLDLLTRKKEDPAVRDLRNFMRRFSKAQLLIENENPRLADGIQRLFTDLE